MPPQKSCESVFNRTTKRSTLSLLIGAAWFLLPNFAYAEEPHYRVELSVPASLSECNREEDLMGMGWFVGAGGLVGFGIAPEIVAGMQLLGGWRWSPSWSMELNVGATIPQETRPSGPTTVHIHTVASLGLAAPCYRVGSFGVCGLVDGSVMWHGRNDILHDAVRSEAFRLGLRGFMDHRFADRWSVRVDVDLAAPLRRFGMNDIMQQVRWTMPRLTGRIGTALVMSF